MWREEVDFICYQKSIQKNAAGEGLLSKVSTLFLNHRISHGALLWGNSALEKQPCIFSAPLPKMRAALPLSLCVCVYVSLWFTVGGSLQACTAECEHAYVLCSPPHVGTCRLFWTVCMRALVRLWTIMCARQVSSETPAQINFSFDWSGGRVQTRQLLA